MIKNEWPPNEEAAEKDL